MKDNMKIWYDPGALVFPFDYALEVGLFILLKNTLLNIYDCVGSLMFGEDFECLERTLNAWRGL